MTETRFQYRKPKPRSNFGISIRADFFTRTFFFNLKEKIMFPTFWGDRSFYKLKKPTCSKLICKYLKFGNNFCFGAFLCGKNTPYYRKLDSSFKMWFGIGHVWFRYWYRTYTKIVVSAVHKSRNHLVDFVDTRTHFLMYFF